MIPNTRPVYIAGIWFSVCNDCECIVVNEQVHAKVCPGREEE